MTHTSVARSRRPPGHRGHRPALACELRPSGEGRAVSAPSAPSALGSAPGSSGAPPARRHPATGGINPPLDGLVGWGGVGEGGLEPPHPFGHRNLNPARLPIPPLARVPETA